MQPAERLWPPVNEPRANRASAILPTLDAVFEERGVYLAEDPKLVRGHAAFYQWPRASPIPEGIAPS